MGTPEAGIAFLQHCIAAPAGGWDAHTLSGLQSITCREPGVVTCRLRVDPQLANRYQTLHGGCIACIVDLVGTAALVTRSKKGGVSVTINTTYHSPAKLGDTVKIEARLVRAGRTLATAEVDVSSETTGDLVARGTHVKYLAPGEPEITAYLPGGPAAEQRRQRAGGARTGPRARL